MKNEPHKQSVYIKAWADGELIEQYSRVDDIWVLNYFPEWRDHHIYRIRDKENGICGYDNDPYKVEIAGHRG